jgi:hypothetical protein
MDSTCIASDFFFACGVNPDRNLGEEKPLWQRSHTMYTYMYMYLHSLVS